MEDFRGGSDDILSAIMPFFEPLLAERNGQTLDQSEFSAAVRSAYYWNFTDDVVEELAPRFEKIGWLKEISRSRDSIYYRVTCDNPAAAPLAESEIKIGQRLSSAIKEFEEFVSKLSPLSLASRTTEEWSDILVEWLVSIDAYTEDVLRQHAITTTKTEGQIGISFSQPEGGRLGADERYLCARFVKHLADQSSPYLADLCKIASVGLLTEVIQDFQKPTTHVSRTSLVVHLDAPVALDLLGVSGLSAQENIRPLVAQLQAIGAQVRIFRTSVEELSRALSAVLARDPSQRTGPTAGALRRNQTSEAYVRSVIANPDHELRRFDVSVTDRTLAQFPNEHPYFSKEAYEELYSRIRWQIEDAPRTHDASVVAFVMRMRGAADSSDIFSSRHVLITRNGILAQSSRRFCLDAGLINRRSCPPVIHQRQLATAVWLRTGFNSGDSAEIPRRYLLAACERVLELKKSVVDQVRLAARGLTPEKAEQLELLLTQDRSAQILMDKTLGLSHLVSSTNVDALVDTMKQALVSEIREEKDAEVAALKAEAATKVRNAHAGRRSAEAEMRRLNEVLQQAEADDRAAIDALIKSANRAIRWRYRIANWIAGFVLVSVALLPLTTELVSGPLKMGLLTLSGIVAVLFGYFQVWDKQMGLRRRVEAWGLKHINNLAAERRLERKLAIVSLHYRDGYLSAEQSITDVEGASGAKLLV